MFLSSQDFYKLEEICLTLISNLLFDFSQQEFRLFVWALLIPAFIPLPVTDETFRKSSRRQRLSISSINIVLSNSAWNATTCGSSPSTIIVCQTGQVQYGTFQSGIDLASCKLRQIYEFALGRYVCIIHFVDILAAGNTNSKCCASTAHWCASGISMAQCCTSARHQYGSILCIRHQYGTMLCIMASIIAQCCVVRHQCGCASCINNAVYISCHCKNVWVVDWN